jgi:hypothetical protein
VADLLEPGGAEDAATADVEFPRATSCPGCVIIG